MIDSAERRRKLLKRLGSNKRISTVSSSSSREVDDLIPEEELEDDIHMEPPHHQIICEADASVHSSSDPGTCHHSSTPQQFTQNLSLQMHRSGLDSGQSMLGQMPAHSAFHHTHFPLRCSACCLDPTVHHSAMFSSSTIAMENPNETSRSHLLARPNDTGESRSAPNQRAGSGLKRQQHVDDGCADAACQSQPTLQLPWPHVPQHHMHNLASDQVSSCHR